MTSAAPDDLSRVIVDEIVSLDGYASRRNGDIDFFLEYREVVETVGWSERMADVSAILLGASTYREFSDYWPGRDPSHPVNRLPKHVVSSTLTSAPWGELKPATVHRNGLADALTAVRGSGDVIVWGSLSLVRGLFDLRAVDELWLRTVPVLIGAGIGFTPGYDVRVDLLSSTTTGSGAVFTRYRVVDDV